MKFNSKNSRFFQILILIASIFALGVKSISAMEQYSDQEYTYPYVKFHNFSGSTINIYFNNRRKETKRTYQLIPQQAVWIQMGLFIRGGEGQYKHGQTLPYNLEPGDLTVGYAKGLSGYKTTDISEIGSELENAENLRKEKKLTPLTDLIVTVEISKDESAWVSGFKYKIKYNNAVSRLGKLQQGSENTEAFESEFEELGTPKKSYKTAQLIAGYMAELELRFTAAFNDIKKRFPDETISIQRDAELFNWYKKEGDLKSAKNLVSEMENKIRRSK